jgi:hypothetical protein
MAVPEVKRAGRPPSARRVAVWSRVLMKDLQTG